jgi:hypothetical protein
MDAARLSGRGTFGEVQRQGLVLLEERTFPHARGPNFNRICTASEPKADAVIGPLKEPASGAG